MGALLSEPLNAMVVERASSASWGAALATMQGWRRTHEDAHILRCNEEFGIFAVLDGHGGTLAAQESAKLLEERLLALAKRGTVEAEEAASELTAAFLSADALLRGTLPAGDGSGTTVVAALMTRSGPGEFCVHLAHSGDSRAVMSAGGELICSEDHKPGRDDERERIVAAGGSVEQSSLGGPLRVDGSLAVSRALGDFSFKPAELAPERCKVTAMPEVRTVPKCSHGDWLLLACDGIFDVMENEELREFVDARIAQSAPERVNGSEVVRELLKLCLERGSKDNCTACLVQLSPEGAVDGLPARELFQGDWEQAQPTVQAKYADFFSAHGFADEAEAIISHRNAALREPSV